MALPQQNENNNCGLCKYILIFAGLGAFLGMLVFGIQQILAGTAPMPTADDEDSAKVQEDVKVMPYAFVGLVAGGVIGCAAKALKDRCTSGSASETGPT